MAARIGTTTIEINLYFAIRVSVARWLEHFNGHLKFADLIPACCLEIVFLRYELNDRPHIVRVFNFSLFVCKILFKLMILGVTSFEQCFLTAIVHHYIKSAKPYCDKCQILDSLQGSLSLFDIITYLTFMI